MCMIGFFHNIDVEERKRVLEKMEIRGRDGYGIYSIKNGEIDKSLNKISTLTKNYFPKEDLLVSTRAIPTTEYESGAGFDVKNQQPFENEQFVVVHNGIIANDKELREKYDIKTESKVDSSILPALFSKLGVVEGLKQIKGSYAILCWNKFRKVIYAAKNFMPLRIYKEGSVLMFISLKEATNLPTTEFEPYSCVEINVENMEVKTYSLYPRERNKKVLVICSGGIDSTTTAYLYKYLGYEITLLHFLYGCAAEKAELICVKKIAKDLGCELIVYNAKKTFLPFKKVSKLLHQKEAEVKDRMLDAESTLSYVPNRNMIFASIAVGVAEMLKCDTVAMGLQQSDSVYPDNNPTYMDALDKTIKYSLAWGTNIKFTAPLIHLIKHEVIGLGKKIGVNYSLVCSCYYPKIKDRIVIKCGQCGCCQYWTYGVTMSEEKDFIGDKDEFINKYVRDYA